KLLTPNSRIRRCPSGQGIVAADSIFIDELQAMGFSSGKMYCVGIPGPSETNNCSGLGLTCRLVSLNNRFCLKAITLAARCTEYKFQDAAPITSNPNKVSRERSGHFAAESLASANFVKRMSRAYKTSMVVAAAIGK